MGKSLALIAAECDLPLLVQNDSDKAWASVERGIVRDFIPDNNPTASKRWVAAKKAAGFAVTHIPLEQAKRLVGKRLP